MEFSAQQIADFFGGEVVGDPSIKVNNLSKIESGTIGTLTFLANPKYTPYIYTTNASIVLVNRDFVPEEAVKATMIRVDNAYTALAKLLEMVQSAIPEKKGEENPHYRAANATVGASLYIGAFAYISENCVIGDNVKIYPHCYIGDNVVIGDNTTLYAGVKIYHNCIIGKHCTIHAGAVIGADGFGFAPQGNEFAKIPQIGNVILEDFVEIGANTTIDRATLGATIVHKGVKLDNLVQLGHNVEIGENTVIAAQTGVAGSTKVGSNCMFGGQVGIAGHIVIGDRVMLGAQSGIPNNVESNATLLGTPGINNRDFAKQHIYLKRLPELNAEVKRLARKIEDIIGQK